MLADCLKAMAEPFNFDLDYQHMSGFGGLLSPNGTIAEDVPPKNDEELTLLNISSNKPLMCSQPMVDPKSPNDPHSIDHLLNVIQNNGKEHEQMLTKIRLRDVLLEYLKTKQSPQTGVGHNQSTGTTSPSLCHQQNHFMQAMDNDCQRVPDSKNPLIAGYPMGGQSPAILTPPISPDIGQPFFIADQQKSSPVNMQFIGHLNNSSEAIDCQQLSETIESLYSPETDETNNNQIPIVEQTVEDLEDESDANQMESSFDENYDYTTVAANGYSSNCQSPTKFNTPIDVKRTKRSAVKTSDDCRRDRKASTQSCPEQSVAAQKRSAHLSAEFRYRTKLNDKISRLRNIVGPKSQLSKSGVLSRSIDLINKLQKSNIKLKEENKRIRILLMQACNQMPGNQVVVGHQHNSPMFIQ